MIKEIRSTATMKRAENTEKMIIEGKAISFDSPTVLYTDEWENNYYEKIAPTALDGCITEDCCLKYNHKDEAPILARTRGGSLMLEKKPDGLYFRAELFDTQFSRDCYELVCADALQCSFSFTVAADGEEYDNSTRTRTITKISRLWDLSIVDVPAYRDTFVKQARAFCEPKVVEERKVRALMELRTMVKDYKPAKEILVGKCENVEELYMDDLETRLSEISAECAGDCDAEALIIEVRSINDRMKKLKRRAEEREKLLESVERDGKVIKRFSDEERRGNNMENIKIRAYQKYVADGSYKNLTTEERAALVVSSAGAVMPTEIFDKMITNEKYSDLLSKATVMNVEGAGSVKVPVASHNTATWKQELAEVEPVNPELTSIELGGRELMRTIKYSAAVEKMSVSAFVDWMATLCASEVVETLESAFVKGDGEATPHAGLENLEWTTNKVDATGEIKASDVAKGLSLMPQKYARNAILLMNANTAYNTVGLFKGTSEYAYNIADGASRFMDKEIHISEYCNDNEIYIVDPTQLYVRFALQPTTEIDRSVGFLSATNTIRCLTIIDFAWNTAGCVKVSLA